MAQAQQILVKLRSTDVQHFYKVFENFHHYKNHVLQQMR